MIQLVAAPGASTLYAQIVHADGTTDRQRLIAYHHPSLLRRLTVRALMLVGVL